MGSPCRTCLGTDAEPSSYQEQKLTGHHPQARKTGTTSFSPYFSIVGAFDLEFSVLTSMSPIFRSLSIMTEFLQIHFCLLCLESWNEHILILMWKNNIFKISVRILWESNDVIVRFVEGDCIYLSLEWLEYFLGCCSIPDTMYSYGGLFGGCSAGHNISQGIEVQYVPMTWMVVTLCGICY